MVIGLLKEDTGRCLSGSRRLRAKAENWAHCDIVCSGLKKVKDDRESVLAFLKPYISSERNLKPGLPLSCFGLLYR